MKRNKQKKIIFFLLSVFNATLAFGQIKYVDLGVNGLTCSQCSRSVEMQLRKVPFVQDVKMDLKHTHAKVYFKENRKIDLNQLPKAVKDAGFSMRYLNISVNLSALNASANCFQFQNAAFYFLQPLKKDHQEMMTFQVIAPGFLPRKNLVKYEMPKPAGCKGREHYFLKAVDHP